MNILALLMSENFILYNGRLFILFFYWLIYLNKPSATVAIEWILKY